MPLKLGAKDVSSVYPGDRSMIRAYAGPKKVFEKYPVPFFEAIAPGVGKEMAPVLRGAGVLSENRSTYSYKINGDGLYEKYDSREPSWFGARKVEQLFRHSEDLTQGSAWAGDLGSTPYRVDFGATQYTYQVVVIGEPILGKAFVVRVGIRGDGPVMFELRRGNVASLFIARYIDFELTETFQNFTFGGVCLEDPDALDNVRLLVVRRGSTTYFEIEPGNGFQLEESTYFASPLIPSEYLLSTSQQVSKFFRNENGISVESNIFTEGQGADYPEIPWIGASPEGTNHLAYSRDLSAWAGDGQLTPQQRGVDGYHLSYLLEDDGVSLQGRSLATGPLSGSSAQFVVWVRRDPDFTGATGFPAVALISGAVDLLVVFDPNTGATNFSERGVPSSAQMSMEMDTPDWYRLVVEISKSAGDPVEVFLYPAFSDALAPITPCDSCSGAILADSFQVLEESFRQAKHSPPIQTSGAAASRNKGRIYFDPSNLTANRATIYFELMYDFPASEGEFSALFGSNLVYFTGPSFGFSSYDGSDYLELIYPFFAGELMKVGLCYDAVANKRVLRINTATSPEKPYAGGYSVSSFRIMDSTPHNGAIRNIRHYDVPYDEGIAILDVLLQ